MRIVFTHFYAYIDLLCCVVILLVPEFVSFVFDVEQSCYSVFVLSSVAPIVLKYIFCHMICDGFQCSVERKKAKCCFCNCFFFRFGFSPNVCVKNANCTFKAYKLWFLRPCLLLFHIFLIIHCVQIIAEYVLYFMLYIAITVCINNSLCCSTHFKNKWFQFLLFRPGNKLHEFMQHIRFLAEWTNRNTFWIYLIVCTVFENFSQKKR